MKHTRIICGTGLALALATLACTAGATGGATLTSLPETSAPVEATATTAPGAITPTVGSSAASFEDACGKGDATLPATAPKFADFAATILSTLNAHTSVNTINAGLHAWGSITDTEGALDASHDLTGDGVSDLLVVAQAPADQFPDFVQGPPGDLYIYGCPAGAASLLFADYSRPDRPTPELIAVSDLNADGLNEIVYTTRNCGASTCFIAPHVIRWDASTQKFASVFPADYAAPSGTMDITDVDGDGKSEIIVHVGFQGSVGAGAQRSFDETFAWNGSQYTLKTRAVTSPQYPIHYLNDADAAVAAKDTATAIPLYQKVIDDPSPLTFLNADEIPALRAYARYRLMLAYALDGDADNAQAAHDALASQFASTPAEAPGGSFAHFADLFWDAYQPGHDVKAGCAPVIALAAANGDTYQILNNFGYANSFYKPENLCPAG